MRDNVPFGLQISSFASTKISIGLHCDLCRIHAASQLVDPR